MGHLANRRQATWSTDYRTSGTSPLMRDNIVRNNIVRNNIVRNNIVRNNIVRNNIAIRPQQVRRAHPAAGLRADVGPLPRRPISPARHVVPQI